MLFQDRRFIFYVNAYRGLVVIFVGGGGIFRSHLVMLHHICACIVRVERGLLTVQFGDWDGLASGRGVLGGKRVCPLILLRTLWRLL